MDPICPEGERQGNQRRTLALSAGMAGAPTVTGASSTRFNGRRVRRGPSGTTRSGNVTRALVIRGGGRLRTSGEHEAVEPNMEEHVAYQFR